MLARRLAVLAILDGWGLGKPGPGNAITQAQTPNMDTWMKDYPHSQLVAKGEAVGLPKETTGNSEVGHLNLGAGYIVPEDQVRINDAIADGSFFTNPALLAACENAKSGRTLHLLTLIGPGQVHSSLEHLWAMLEMAQKQHVAEVYVHAFSDGRDSSPSWLGKNAEAIEHKILSFNAKLASVSGRYYAMDRDKRWDRVDKCYRALTERKGQHAISLDAAAANSYTKGISDEFIEPTVIGNGRAIQDQDSVIFLNFRTDRPRELTAALNDPHFVDFHRTVVARDLAFYTMTEYDAHLPVSGVVFAPVLVELPLAKVLADAGLKQLHAAETEKYAHVTYFFNGGREEPFDREDRIMIPSPKVATYDLKPGMSAQELTSAVVDKLQAGVYDVVVMNFANADMVGHTGNLAATMKAVEVLDDCLGQLQQAVQAQDGVLFITADHGNAEVMVNPVTREIDTEHNPSNVPFMAIGAALPGSLQNGALASVSPTILQFLGLDIPAAMTEPPLWAD